MRIHFTASAGFNEKDRGRVVGSENLSSSEQKLFCLGSLSD